MAIKNRWVYIGLQTLRVAATAAIMFVAGKLSYGHVIRLSLLAGMKPEDALWMPWSVDALMVVCSLTVIIMGHGLPWRAKVFAFLGRYAGLSASLAANVMAGDIHNWTSIAAYAWAPFALFVTMEILLHGAVPDDMTSKALTAKEAAAKAAVEADLLAEQVAAAARSARSRRGARTRKEKTQGTLVPSVGGTSPKAKASDALGSALNGVGIVDMHSSSISN